MVATLDPGKAYDLAVITIRPCGRCPRAVARPERWYLGIPKLREVKQGNQHGEATRYLRLVLAAFARPIDQNKVAALARLLDQDCGTS